LAEDPLRYRRQILAIKRYFSRHQATVMLVDDWTGENSDSQLHSLVHGVISLERLQGEYGSMRRRLQVGKLRDRAIREGYHDFVIRQDGIEIFPRLVAAEHRTSHAQQAISSGVERLDALLGGGLAKGTSTLVVGAAGTGKSSLATQFAMASAIRGERAALYLFDEAVATFTERSTGLGMDIAPLIAAKQMIVRQVDPAELSPGEFACTVRNGVVKHNTQMVVIDSLNGFLNATPSERFLALHLHELLMFLGQQGVTTLLLMTQHGIIGGDVYVPVDASYLADTVVLLRYFEAMGEVRQAISVIKKRTGNHERTIREMNLNKGITIGEPLRNFQGILTGSPTWIGETVTRTNERRKKT
jgi:circadian clock protein KaiC